MIGKCGIMPEDAKDVEQMLLIHLMTRRSRYDKNHELGATPEQFTNFILNKALLNILEARRRDKRSIHISCLSLDYEIPNDEGEPTSFGDLLDEDAPFIRGGRAPSADITDLKLDIERIFNELPSHQREIGNLFLQGYRASDISRKLGRSRAALDREIVKMRRTLYEAGLQDYVGAVNSARDAVEEE